MQVSSATTIHGSLSLRTVIGRGNRAFEVYQKTCPAYVEDISEIHRTEPYVYSQMVAGRDAKYHGEAKNSWLTGYCGMDICKYLPSIFLGVYPTHHGLGINPFVSRKASVISSSPENTVM